MTGFLIYVFVTSITPGPSNLFILNSSKEYGLSGAKKFICGVLAGFLFLAIISIIFLFTLEELIMKIETFLKIFGFLYLIYLACKTYASTKTSINNETYLSFKSGFLLQILNMKSLLFFVTLLGAFILPISNMKITVYIYMAITVIIGWACLLIWGILGNYLKEFLNRHNYIFKVIMSLLLLYSALNIFL
ncbi:LysE family translocator [Staphylococcus shinii]|uniref:LysE family translocator n=1 Tax=Staphylococcus shinii TaxID=2912228 RepID=UPI003F56CBEE